MLRKTKEQGMLNIFSNNELTRIADEAENIVNEGLKNEKNSDARLNSLAEEQKARKLEGFNPLTSKGSSIISANAGRLTDMGGTSKQIRLEVSNSIFDINRNERRSQEKDPVLLSRGDKENSKAIRKAAEEKRINDLVEGLKTIDQSKAVSLPKTKIEGEIINPGFKASKNNLSVFDKLDFERLPVLTEGEELSKEILKKKSENDESWRDGGKSITNKDINKRLFDSFTEKKE